MSAPIIRFLFPACLLLAGCGTVTETNYDEGTVASTETIQYGPDGKAKVINKQVDPMMPYGTDEQGIREAEDMDLLEAPPE